ncbi:S-adenosyl-L-methionine-dependent methyltransferase [Parathielavia appendiculata]|uniref:S-adenosyl-L-methionine-dependent methyltransferase n=1 Tax=Parathielavia appendiculata TaxID=2587402 RepID=A0AAN6U302_9PEZI|nr:S-adenosyl-L-methionine-dependent methyltransferase [Parathielavia appendiculata]
MWRTSTRTGNGDQWGPCRSLDRTGKTPFETMICHCWAENSLFAVLSLGIEAGVWAHLSSDEQPRTVVAIADATGMEEAMLARLLKHVAAMGAGNTGGLGRCVLALPSYLRKTNYTSPTSMTDGNLQYDHDIKFNCSSGYTPMSAAWPSTSTWAAYSHGRPKWTDAGFYPVQERLLDDFDASCPDAAFLVDIGGNLGHNLQSFLDRFPTAPGRLVLQDLEHVISAIPPDSESSLSPRIERTVYDFHTPQPVKGARAYYMHSILHNWPDEVCCAILRNVKAAMCPGYSRLLINENVIPNTGAQWEATALDVLMLALLSSKKRTRVKCVRLLEEKAGLKVNEIDTFANGVESLIELVVPE